MAGGDRKPRGEVGELSAQLQGLCTKGKRTDKEMVAAKREVFKKVINYMTLGMDMSVLFPMMISAANLSADDVVLKKQLYLYITHYASSTPDLCLLTINQLQKDCRDQDPTVRGLALRSLCSLRIANLLEYVVAPVQAGLSDRHPYVRRTAVMGVLKIWHMSPDTVAATGMVDAVRAMLYQDADAQVAANCLQLLSRLEPPARLAADKALVYHLLNRLRDFSEWAQCAVLEVVAHHRPATEGEVFDVLNAIEDRLNATNSAVVLAAVKAFLHLTLGMAATHQQVLERVKDPLKTLIARDDPAVAYAVLAHARLLVSRAPILFEGDHAAFYVRSHDPWHVKRLKLEALTLAASSANAYEIVGELTEYARDVDPATGRGAVKAIGRIALAVPDAAGVVERLLTFLEPGAPPHLSAEALLALKDLLRAYPDLGAVLDSAGLRPARVTEPAARAALVWVLGAFCEHVPAAPYLLEPLAANFAAEPPAVRLALLPAAARVFFRRPAEGQKLLGSCLAGGLADADQDVRDRALLYHRLLRRDVSAAEAVICAPLAPARHFDDADDDTDGVGSAPASGPAADAVFAEFNTLSVVYGRPAAQFVEAAQYHSAAGAAGGDALGDDGGGGGGGGGTGGGGDQGTSLLEADLLSLDDGPPSGGGAGTSGGGAGVGGGTSGGGGGAGGSLLDLDIDFGVSSSGGGGGAAGAAAVAAAAAPPPPAAAAAAATDLDSLLGAAAPAAAAAAPPAPPLELSASARVAPATFQEKWRALPAAHASSAPLSDATLAALLAGAHRDFCAHVAQARLHTVACGGQAPTYKFYFYGADAATGALTLVELVVNAGARPATAAVTVKTEAPATLPAFLDVWAALMAGFAR